MGATFLHLMIKPYPPSPCANEVVCASFEELGNAVACSVEGRPVVQSQDRVGKHEFGFAPFDIGGNNGTNETFIILPATAPEKSAFKKITSDLKPATSHV